MTATTIWSLIALCAVVTAAIKGASKFDTSLPGNGNGGYLYGTSLSADEKRALIEYLKTL